MGDVPLTEAEATALQEYARSYEHLSHEEELACRAEAVRRIRAAERERATKEERERVLQEVERTVVALKRGHGDLRDDDRVRLVNATYDSVAKIVAALRGTEARDHA